MIERPRERRKSGTATVWWEWTAPASGDVQVDTYGSRLAGDPTTTLDTVLDELIPWMRSLPGARAG